MTDADDVREAAQVCGDFLGAVVDADWTASIPDLDFSVASVVAHAAEGCLWYAIDLAAGGRDLPSVEHRVTTNVSNQDLVDTLTAYAGVLAAVIEASPPSARGFHPMGTADPSGFAAMACDEMLVHTHDAAQGLGLSFRPTDELARSVLTRLFPWVRSGDDAWEQLRWANGRLELADSEQLDGWAWHCAPLDEWDGSIPSPPV
ncbi:MAG: maleylpyruvate isomerase N-terminal domain-containing protein [Ilumatobacteraceae bacterium]